MELFELLLLWGGGIAAAVCGLTLCFFGIRVPPLGRALTVFLWAAACPMLVSFDMAGTWFTEDPVWYARFAIVALVVAVICAAWRKAGGAASAFLFGGTVVYFVAFALLRDTWGTALAALPLFAALFAALALAVPGAMYPRAVLVVLVPLTGAVFAVAGVLELLHQKPVLYLYNHLLDGSPARRGWAPTLPAWQLYTAAAFVATLWAVGLICQLAGLHRTSAVQKATAVQQADIPALQSTPEPQPAAVPAAAWVCGACGTRNTGRFCTHCGTPRP